MRWRIPALAALLGTCVLGAPAQADLLDRLNQLRFKDCRATVARAPALRRSSGLDAVAHEWSKGGRLADAVARTSYLSNKVASMQVTGSPRDAQIVGLLLENYCNILTDPRFSEVGLFRRADGVWIVVAAPTALPDTKDSAAIGARVLELVNQARRRPRRCGDVEFAAAKPLRASAALDAAAAMHALDMARNRLFQHEGSDGSTPAARVTRAGYAWSMVAENIAAGTISAEEAVQGWLDSPGHCANIMQPQLTEMGVAYTLARNAKPSIYWSQVLAKPRK